MATRAKTAKRQPRQDLAEAPNEHRRQHTPFTRDVLTPPGAPIVARHRTRTLLTPLAVRRAIIEDAAAKPEPVRVRSLRRRLTLLDRASVRLRSRSARPVDQLHRQPFEHRLPQLLEIRGPFEPHRPPPFQRRQARRDRGYECGPQGPEPRA